MADSNALGHVPVQPELWHARDRVLCINAAEPAPPQLRGRRSRRATELCTLALHSRESGGRARSGGSGGSGDGGALLECEVGAHRCDRPPLRPVPQLELSTGAPVAHLVPRPPRLRILNIGLEGVGLRAHQVVRECACSLQRTKRVRVGGWALRVCAVRAADLQSPRPQPAMQPHARIGTLGWRARHRLLDSVRRTVVSASQRAHTSLHRRAWRGGSRLRSGKRRGLVREEAVAEHEANIGWHGCVARPRD